MILEWSVNDIQRADKPDARGLVQHQRMKPSDPALLMLLFTFSASVRRYFTPPPLSLSVHLTSHVPTCSSLDLRNNFQTSLGAVIGLTIFCEGPSTSLVRRFLFSPQGYSSVSSSSSRLSFLPLSCVSSLWESATDVYIVEAQGWSATPALPGVGVVSDFIIKREIGCLCPSSATSPCLSLSPLYVWFPFFLSPPHSGMPLAIQQKGALQELKATEQQKKRKTESGKETGGV